MTAQKKEKVLMPGIKIYLDDDIDSNVLFKVLMSIGFIVISPRQVNMRGKNDEEHLTYATSQGAVLLTRNCTEFKQRHLTWQKKKASHAGILAVYRYNNPKKEMSYRQIVRAFQNILKLNIELNNRLYKLNDFNY